MGFYVNKKKNKKLKFVFLILFVFELIACYYAYYTVGEVKQMGFIFLLFLNIIAIILYFLRNKLISILMISIIGIMIIPNQIILLKKWSDLKKEAVEIHKFIYTYKDVNNEFPKNILQYEFKNKKLTKYFSYRNNDKVGFGLQYYIGTKGTTHYYNHNSGKWAYYPD